jgi:uncharacterized UPF0160 family protein
MNWLKSKKVVAVHNGSFHPDDVFSVALLSILHDGRIKVIRTRDEKIYSQADYVVDVGLEYDPTKNKFDHHQVDGAGLRGNKIPYSTIGLLWQKYGEKVCGSKEVADLIDAKLIVVIDADDTNFNIYKPIIDGLKPFQLTDIIYSMGPNWKERQLDANYIFLKAVDFAKGVLLREIKVAKDRMEIITIIRSYYEKSLDKKLIIIDSPKVSRFEIWDALDSFSEPLFVVYGSQDDWALLAMRVGRDDFRNRKSLPASWGGLAYKDLVKITGVSDVLFCHPGLFLAGAKSKEGAIMLAKKALEN